MSDDINPEENALKCKYCKADLRPGAIVCNECKNHQNVFRNLALLIGQLAGLLGIFGACFVFMISQISTVYDNLSDSPRVEMLKIESFPNFVSDIALLNLGKSDIFVTDIGIYWRSSSVALRIDRIIQPGKIEYISWSNNSQPESQLAFVLSTTQTPNDELIKNSELDYNGNSKACYAIKM